MWRTFRKLEWDKRILQRRYMSELRKRGIAVGPGAVVARGVAIGPYVESIGRGTRIHRNCVLKGRSPISVGSFCELAEGVHVVSSNHEVNRANLHVGLQQSVGAGDLRETRGSVRIGNNVWIGDNAIVLSGVTIGDGAVVAAGAVVTKDVAPFAIVAGAPARTLRKRFSEEVIAELERLAWWQWPEERMASSRRLFELDLTQEGAAQLLREYAR